MSFQRHTLRWVEEEGKGQFEIVLQEVTDEGHVRDLRVVGVAKTHEEAMGIVYELNAKLG